MTLHVRIIYTLWQTPRAGSGVVRIDPLRFLAECRRRRQNQISSSVCRVS